MDTSSTLLANALRVGGALSRTPSPLPKYGDDMELQGSIEVPVDILHVIIANSSTPGVLVWRQTSRAFYRAASTTLRMRYEDCVRPFVPDLKRFDSVLRLTGAIVSGSVALSFFLYFEEWAPSDLDIYVPNHRFNDFVREVTCPDGLNFIEEERVVEEGRSAHRPIWPVREIRRFTTPSNRNVDVIRSSTGSPITPIFSFWSTLVQNFLTPDGAACGFPDATLERRGFVAGNAPSAGTQRAIEKYAERGFSLVRDEWRLEYHPAFIRQQRYFGDRNAIVVTFRRSPLDPLPSIPIHATRRSWFPSRPYPPRSFVTYNHLQMLAENAHPDDVADGSTTPSHGERTDAPYRVQSEASVRAVTKQPTAQLATGPLGEHGGGAGGSGTVSKERNTTEA